MGRIGRRDLGAETGGVLRTGEDAFGADWVESLREVGMPDLGGEGTRDRAGAGLTSTTVAAGSKAGVGSGALTK